MAIRVFVCKKDVLISFFYPPENFYYEQVGNICSAGDQDTFAMDFNQRAQIKLLKYVLLYDHTIFNQVQLPHLKDDIEWVLKHNLIEEKMGKMLLNAAKVAMSNPELYLKFEVD